MRYKSCSQIGALHALTPGQTWSTRLKNTIFGGASRECKTKIPEMNEPNYKFDNITQFGDKRKMI